MDVLVSTTDLSPADARPSLPVLPCDRRFRSRGHLIAQLDPLRRPQGGPWLGPIGDSYTRSAVAPAADCQQPRPFLAAVGIVAACTFSHMCHHLLVLSHEPHTAINCILTAATYTSFDAVQLLPVSEFLAVACCRTVPLSAGVTWQANASVAQVASVQLAAVRCCK
jgi:hypothetical protein